MPSTTIKGHFSALIVLCPRTLIFNNAPLLDCVFLIDDILGTTSSSLLTKSVDTFLLKSLLSTNSKLPVARSFGIFWYPVDTTSTSSSLLSSDINFTVIDTPAV
ncbi:hypothetical protein D3C86_1586450 [compost metagenome]